MRSLILSLFLFLATSIFASYPESTDFEAESTSINNEYIVVLKPEFDTQSFSVRNNEKILKRFRLINAMLVETDDPDNLQREGVAYVEPNVRLHILTDQSNATWGLDRIDSRSGLDSKYKYSNTGSGVHTYIVDTGIKANHKEFSGRIGSGFSSISGGTDDCNGHGTHVAGTVAGTTYGVAKKAIIHPVRVLDCDGSGTTSGVIQGVEWVANNAQKPAVANMSLGGSKLQSLNDAVKKAIDTGVIFVVAAGNNGRDACNGSPGSTPEAITVAASDKSDVSASFTSNGRCVDIYAPGVSITSAGISGDSSTATMSGTSMASPHTAGVAALLLGQNPNASPATISSKLINNATRGIISNVPSGTPNIFLYTNPSATNPDPDPDPEPNPEIPSKCNDSWACYTSSGSLTATSYYKQEPKDYVVVNYPRPLEMYVKGTADIDLYLYHSSNGGQSWTQVAKAIKTGYAESMTYQANTRGMYTWIVMLKTSGASGSYNLWLVK